MRQGDLTEFFSHDNQPHPPSPAKGGVLRFGVKAGLLRCLESISSPKYTRPNIDGNDLEGSVLVNQIKPEKAKNFLEYANGSCQAARCCLGHLQ